MLLTIHDANLQKVAFIDNNKQATLNYYNDTWTRSLETGSSTFEFTVFKKAIQSDTATQKTYNLLNEKAFVSFKYHGKSYVFSVMTVEEDEYTIKCYCENLNLELINEYANPYKSDKAMSFVEYCNAMDLLNFTHLSVGINEIADQKRTLEWEGQDTKLARLLSLAKKFDAEIDFDTQLNADSTIKSFKVNVYHEHDDEHQGVGRVRNDVQLIYRRNLKSITRKIDKTGIYTMVIPTGKRTVKNGKGEEVEQIVTIGDLKPPYTENNKDGVREFYQSGNALYAPIAAQMYPSTFTSGTQRDQWIRKDLEVDSDNPTVIRAAGIRNLKKNAYPALSYEVDGFLDVEIGDTCKVYDDGFAPELLVQARVSIQKISFTKPETNKTTFANFKELERNLSAGIQAAFERLFEASKPYTIKLSTDNGVMFKNNAGQTIITPALYKGGKIISNDVTWRWSLDGNVTTGMTYLIKGSGITNTAILSVAAYIGNDEVTRDELTFVNVNDGQNGAKGADGKTPYIHFAYAESADGKQGFSTTQTGNKRYIGTYTDYTQADSTDPTKYKWVDMVGTVEVGGRNLLRNSEGPFKPDKKPSDYDNCEYYPKSTIYMVNGKQYILTAETDGVITSNHGGENASDNVVIWLASPDYNIHSIISDGKTDKSGTVFTWAYPTGTYMLRVNTYKKVSDKSVWKIKIAEGNTKSGWSPASEDVEDNINSKADNALTQEQLNALNEKNSIMQAELEAKASLDTVNQWFKAYQDFVNSNAADKAKAEKDLIAATQRVAKIENNLGDMAQRWNFIDTYMQATNEGLSIGKKDGSSFVRMGDNRISFYSAGKEVAYFSGGALQVDNGVFTKTLQIGRFREEQYHLNPDMNVIRYVGGA